MKIHFVGIGGIGVSALAQYYLLNGHSVSGEDVVSKGEIIEKLKEMGVNISKVDSCDLVIYSPAVDRNQIKIKAPKIMSYPEALGEISKKYFTIAISGTHGKSTTTAMLSLILIEAGLDPTVIVGTKLKEFNGSNFRMGHSQYLIIEACEHEASFLNYHPDIGVVLNIEADHLDYYQNIEKIRDAFATFESQSKKVIKNVPVIDDLKMNVPGLHNKLNASFAVAVAREIGISDEVSFRAISKFSGTWRRFDEHIYNNLIIIDDYAHHPTEILATIKSIREKYPDKKIYCFFQPHQHQRTFLLLNDFVDAFNQSLKIIDKLFLIDVYDVCGRESKDIKINSQEIAKMVEGLEYIKKEDVSKEINEADVVIFMGAGDIYNLSCDIRKNVI
ncbi:MAG: UDP-N-acetylmuramate--L-alanine ligase [Parcubacteria group bacterium]|nr:UDP-N-acetylmuramate--L-alanine ligase [Parcubacteria group bacterium]